MPGLTSYQKENLCLPTVIDLVSLLSELDYKEAQRQDKYGNLFRYRTKVRDLSGAQIGRWAYDVFLAGPQ